MKKSDFRLVQSIRVRWAEVDAQGIVFNPHYSMYADIGVTEYYRAIGMPYPNAFQVEAEDLFTKKSTIVYHASARYDDEIDILVRGARLGKSSFDFLVGVFRGDEALAEILITYVNANPHTRKSVPLADTFKNKICDFEVISPEGSAQRV